MAKLLLVYCSSSLIAMLVLALLFLPQTRSQAAYSAHQSIVAAFAKEAIDRYTTFYIGTRFCRACINWIAGSAEFLFLFGSIGWGLELQQVIICLGRIQHWNWCVACWYCSSSRIQEPAAACGHPDFFVIVFFIALGTRPVLVILQYLSLIVVISPVVRVIRRHLLSYCNHGFVGYTVNKLLLNCNYYGM